MPKQDEPNYEGLYVLGLKKGKGKFQFLHKVKNGAVVRNGIHSNILILKEEEPNSLEAFKTINKNARFKDFTKYPLKDIVEQNKTASK